MDNKDDAGITNDLVTREALYELVWAQPMLKVGERFGVSSSYLARICTMLNVPRPERGYWAKLAVGKAPAIPQLPAARPGDEIVWSRSGQVHNYPRPLPRAPKNTERPKKHERLTELSKPRLMRTHDLIGGARLHFESGRVSREIGYLKPYKRALVDIISSQASLTKALAFANQLFLELQAQGHRVALAPSSERMRRHEIEYRENPKGYEGYNEIWAPDRPTVVYVGSVAIGLTVIEMSEQVTVRYVDGKYVRVSDFKPPAQRNRHVLDRTWTTERSFASGRLRLQAYSPYPGTKWSRQWAQGDAPDLAVQVPAIVLDLQRAAVEIERLAEDAHKKAEVERQRWGEQQRQWEREQAEQKAAKALKDSKDELLSIIQKWSLAKGIEAFFQEIELAVTQLPDEHRIYIASRLQLGRELIGDLNPLGAFRAWKSPEERLRRRTDVQALPMGDDEDD